MKSQNFNVIYQTLFLERFSKLGKLVIDVVILYTFWSGLSDYFEIKIIEAFLFFSITHSLLCLPLGIYSPSYRYFTLSDLFKLGIYLSFLFLIIYYWRFYHLEISNTLNLFFITQISFLLPRLLIRGFSNRNFNTPEKKAYIFGAGINGVSFKRAYQNNLDFEILGFLDDDVTKSKQTIDGIKVFHFKEKIYLKSNQKELLILFSQRII